MNMATEKTDGVPRSAWARWGSTIFSLAAILFTSVFSVACGKGDSRDGAWQPDNYGTRVEMAGDKIVIRVAGVCGDFQAVEFKKGKLTARIHVHDGNAIKYVFEKVE